MGQLMMILALISIQLVKVQRLSQFASNRFNLSRIVTVKAITYIYVTKYIINCLNNSYKYALYFCVRLVVPTADQEVLASTVALSQLCITLHSQAMAPTKSKVEDVADSSNKNATTYGGRPESSKIEMEFGGPIGVTALMIWSHYILIYFW